MDTLVYELALFPMQTLNPFVEIRHRLTQVVEFPLILGRVFALYFFLKLSQV